MSNQPPRRVTKSAARPSWSRRFVWLGDACCGLPNGPHSEALATLGSAYRQLGQAPDHVVFVGDHVDGYVDDAQSLQDQWDHFLANEFNFVADGTPVFHTTSNHNTYDETSERIFRAVFPQIPANGPADQIGLSCFVRDEDLLMVFVNTAFSGLGGDGHVETAWLDEVLAANADAACKLVFGHHPAFPVNGYEGCVYKGGAPDPRASVIGATLRRWTLAPEDRERLWRTMERHGVIAYVCSHVIAYDVQVRRGILQICTAGAGTRWGVGGMMPGATEYHHLVRGVIEHRRLTLQAIDTAGRVREWLEWPLPAPSAGTRLEPGIAHRIEAPARWHHRPEHHHLVDIQITGNIEALHQAGILVRGWHLEEGPPVVEARVSGESNRLEVQIVPRPGLGQQLWTGPALGIDGFAKISLRVHTGMGPGGVMYRLDDAACWQSLDSTSSQGAEHMMWPDSWVAATCERSRADSIKVSISAREVVLPKC